MKRSILVVLFLGLVALPALGQADLIVGIEQQTEAEWEGIVRSFTARFDASVDLQTYRQTDIAQQIVMQSFRKSGELHLVMVPESWGSSLARYLVDLKEEAAALAARGVRTITLGGRVAGVPLPFATGWFLAVIEWPEDRELAVEFLVHAASGSTTSVEVPSTPQTAVASISKQKLPASDHNPILDGALEAVLEAARLATSTPSSAAGGPTAGVGVGPALAGVAAQFGIPFSPATGTITVVLRSSPGRSATSTAAALASIGVGRAAIETTSSLVKATVSLEQLSDLASRVSGISFIRPPYVPFPLATSSQGVSAIGANAFHAAGLDGNGVKIAVIDLGFAGLSQAQANGDLPYSVQQNDLTGTGLTSGITHGTAVAEIIHDVAPSAELHLIKIADEVDLDAAVTYCLSRGIDIINHSLGWYNTNFYDGTGTIADTARRAISGGILWVNAAGNEAESHWEGIFSDGNSDGWLDQEVTLSATAGAQIVLFLTWNDWPQASSDYDLYLYDPSDNLIASSTKYQTGTEEPTESIQVSASTSGTYTIRIQGSGHKSLELFSLNHSLSPVVASSSILAPANVSEVIAVGAIDHAHYTTGPQEPYSSRGPTNDGRTKPDLCAPDKTSTGTAPYTTFHGTSGAAPFAAGAAALLLDQNPSLNEPALRARLLSQTIPMGSPNIFGNGRLSLFPPTSPNQSPTAAFTFSPPSPLAGAPVSFNGTNSTDPDGAIVSYAWTFGDGANGSSPTTSHVYATPGSYTARLTVTDDDGATDTASSTIYVSAPANQPPTASFTVSPGSGPAGTLFLYNAAASFDPDGAIVSYQWEYGDGSFGTGQTSQHVYATPGTYTVRLTILDDDSASDTTTRTVSVQSAGAPDLVIQNMVHSPTSPTIGQNVAFTITVRNAGNAGAGLFRVRLVGSASSTQTYVTQLAAGASQTFTLALPLTTSPETFTATADDLGQVAESNESNNTRSSTVASAAVPPSADAGGPYAGIPGSAIVFDGSGSTGQITTYLWSFGDGTTGQGISVSHAYASPGTYPVTLTVYGQGGLQSTDSTQAVIAAVGPPLSVQLSIPRTTYEVGEAISVTFTTNRTAYVYLCDVAADGRVTLMLPNWIEPGNPLSAGTYVVPGGPYTLRITEPIGTETLYLFAAASPLPQFPTSFGSGFPQLSTNPTAFRNSVLNTMQTQLPSGDWAYDTLSFQVVSAPPAGGTLQVFSSPSGATVELDGSPIGTTPLTRQDVAPGVHTVRLSRSGYATETRQVVITAGQTSTVSVTLTPVVSNQPPIASFTYAPLGPTVGEVVQFDASGSHDPDGSIAAYTWTFGDGTSGSGAIATRAFSAPGSYSVRLVVTDNDGATTSEMTTVSVTEPETGVWVSPTAADDVDGWADEKKVFDNKLETYAESRVQRSGSWSPTLVLHAPGGGLLSDGLRLRINGFVHIEYDPTLRLDIDVYRNGQWVDVFDDVVELSKWVEIPYAQGTVAKARIRVTASEARTVQVFLHEFDFRDASAVP